MISESNLAPGIFTKIFEVPILIKDYGRQFNLKNTGYERQY